MKKIQFMDTSFRDGFQSFYGARVKTKHFIPALEAAVEAGTTNFEIGGGARFQSLYFYCQEDAFDMMDKCRKVVGPDINLQTLARGANVVGLVSQSRDIIDLHAKLFKKHGVSTIRNFDALNDTRNLSYSGECITKHGLKHQIVISVMGLAPDFNEKYAHTPKYYSDILKKIIKEDIPFDSICYKDASGTVTPKVIFETIKEARKLLPKGTTIQFHTHDTAGMAVACNLAAIEAGADIIDLSMRPVSGGTGQADILTMWHRLKGTEFELDVDYKKIMEAEEILTEQMEKYFLPPEANEVNPLITFSPMPGGALTANTQMMRDNNCLPLFPKVIKEMHKVVAKGGFGTSVTPVSQFYFQQAFANVTQGKWKKMTDSYGKMVLGYFGKTPVEPDKKIVKLASEMLGLEPTNEDVHDLNDKNPDLGIKAAKKKLEEFNLDITDENIFIASTCEEKGIEFLRGNKKLGIRYKEEYDPKKKEAKRIAKEIKKEAKKPETYDVTVDGVTYNVHVAPGGKTDIKPAAKAPEGASAPVEAPAPAPQAAAGALDSSKSHKVESPMPGTVWKVLVKAGDSVKAGDTVVILEAMKMETEVKTKESGKVHEVLVSEGQVLTASELLVLVEKGA